jgi:hypothetical protein
LRPARVRIPICLDSDAKITVLVNGKVVRTISLLAAAGGRLALRLLVQNVTRWTESFRTAQIQLRFSYDGQPHRPILLMGDEQSVCRPELIQRWTWGYARTSLLYFGLAWGTIPALAVVILASFRIHNAALRTYAVVGACVLWLAGLMGIPDLAHIPVKGWIRRSFGATRSEPNGFLRRNRRALATGLLAACFVGSASGATRVLWCYRVRQHYESLIRKAMRTTDGISPAVFEALSQIPWRPEAQILAEKSAWEARGGDSKDRFRRIAAKLAAQPQLEAAIRSAPPREHLPFYLDRDDRVLSNPLTWYASVIIEGERFDEEVLVKRAIDLLRPRTDPESRLLLANLVIILRHKDEAIREQEVMALEHQIDSGLPDAVMGTHSYLAACDMLAGYHLAGCEKAEASKWLQQELDARMHYRSSGTLWLRPPEKFLAYYMFALYGNLDGGGELRGAGAEHAKELTQRCDFRSAFQDIARSFPRFSSTEEWQKGTVIAQREHMENYLDDSLRKGWRY